MLIEILARLVERYLLSPYLTDVIFWGIYSRIPAVMLIAWTHGKPGKDKTTRIEKVGVPINLIATLASVNYALAIWKDADENYVRAKKALLLAGELHSVIQ